MSETYYGANTATTRHALYSCTKSFTSTLFGIARDRGLLGDLDEPVRARFPGRSFDHTDALKEAMTLENLLTMTSGLDWTEADATYREMYMSDDWVSVVMDLPMREAPGTQFNYCSGCTHVLSAVVQGATGEDGVDFAREALLAPLGITDFAWERDAQGLPSAAGDWDLTPRDRPSWATLFLHEDSGTASRSSSRPGWTRDHLARGRWGRSGLRLPVVDPSRGSGLCAQGRYGRTTLCRRRRT